MGFQVGSITPKIAGLEDEGIELIQGLSQTQDSSLSLFYDDQGSTLFEQM